MCKMRSAIPDVRRVYWRERREPFSLAMEAGMSGWEIVFSLFPLVNPQRSHRDLRALSAPGKK